MSLFPAWLTRLRTVVGAAILALAVVGGTAVTAQAAPVGPQAPVGPCAPLHSFYGIFDTGSDDLRGDSEVIMWLQTNTGNVELQHFWGPFANNSTNTENLTFLNSNWTVNSCSVTGLTIEMISHPSGFETTDNWNLNSVELYGYSTTGAYSWHFWAGGNPLHRFTGSDPYWSGQG
jgi:hypothetical protein